jgi:hypothetical protein
MIASDTTRPSGSVTARRDSRVGVIGLGHMGHTFALRIVREPRRARFDLLLTAHGGTQRAVTPA